MSEIWLLFSIMASSLANVSDSELVEEFRRRSIVFQWYKKNHIEELCNDGEEIDEEMYEAFKDWLENICTNHREIEEATEEMWVAGFNPPHSYTVEAESHGMKYSTLMSFSPEGDGTKVTWDFNGTALTKGAKIMAPIFNVLMKGTMKKCMVSDLEALRDVCQNGEG